MAAISFPYPCAHPSPSLVPILQETADMIEEIKMAFMMLIYSCPMLINKYNLKLLSAVMHFNAGRSSFYASPRGFAVCMTLT